MRAVLAPIVAAIDQLDCGPMGQEHVVRYSRYQAPEVAQIIQRNRMEIGHDPFGWMSAGDLGQVVKQLIVQFHANRLQQ